MTNPNPGSSLLEQDNAEDQQLYWEAQKAKREAAGENLSHQTAIHTPAEALLDPEKDFQNTVNQIKEKGRQYTDNFLKLQQEQKSNISEQDDAKFRSGLLDAVKGLADQAQEYKQQLNDYYQHQSNVYQQQLQQWSQSHNINSNAMGQLYRQGKGRGVVDYITGNDYTGNISQIARYAKQAGFPDSAIPMAVSIALAESGGRADAVNNANSNGSSDFGLMQINTVHSGLLSKYDWSDPAQNMQMAYQVWKDAGGSWTPWATYNNGSYKQYAQQGNSASKAVETLYKQPAVVGTAKGLRKAIVSDAKQYFGIPYKWGGNGPSEGEGFDCSGLVQQVYSAMGIDLPRTANTQKNYALKHYGYATGISNLMPGDLVVWTGGIKNPSPTSQQLANTSTGHIAIYAGNGNIIEAQQSGVPVHIRNLNSDDDVYGVHLLPQRLYE